MTVKKGKKVGCLKSINDFREKYWKAVGVIITIAGTFYTIGYKTAEVFKERELMIIENKHSEEILKLKEEYMEKYYSLREQQLLTNLKDSTDENKIIQKNH